MSIAISRIKELFKKQGVTIYLEVDTDLERTGFRYTFEKKDRILIVLIGNLSNDERKELLEVIKEVHNGEFLIWKSSKTANLASYKQYHSKNSDRQVLSFFQPILSTDDYDALRASLFLRAEGKSGKSIGALKADIRDRFGTRGANISNLCSANYFEDEFIPLFNISARKDFDEYYEIAVGKRARALFVHAGMSVKAIRDEVETMVYRAIKYRMKNFRLHGIGETNVENITQFITERTGDEKYLIRKEHGNKKSKNIEYTIEVT